MRTINQRMRRKKRRTDRKERKKKIRRERYHKEVPFMIRDNRVMPITFSINILLTKYDWN